MCSAPRWVQSLPKHFLTYCVPLSVRRCDGISYGTTDASKNIHATTVAIILAVGTACVSLVYLSVIITTCCLHFAVWGSRTKISIATNSPGQLLGKVVEGACAKCGSSFGTAVEATHAFVHIDEHIRPNIIFLHGFILTSLPRVTGTKGMT